MNDEVLVADTPADALPQIEDTLKAVFVIYRFYSDPAVSACTSQPFWLSSSYPVRSFR